ncbi:hypothetical protein MMC06_002594 [Schaereria dolodes]|nr:hypothetical protein [Schaereria dolodes]
MAQSTTISSAPITLPETAPVFTTLPNTSNSTVSSSNQPSTANAGTFLKPISPRKRRRSPESPDISPSTNIRLGKATITHSPKSPLSSQYLPKPFTGAAAMADERRQKEEIQRAGSRQQSPNVQRDALTALLGSQGNGMSLPSDAPNAANTMSGPIAAIAASITIPEKAQGDGSVQTSPVSMSSFGTLESAGARTVTANGHEVASPGPIGEGATEEPETPQGSDAARTGVEDSNSNKALTYPGPLLSAQVADARRGMSLPHSGLVRDNSRSPSTNKKHKCPYCSTDFTRHHNLKSHLLTHSHEKPYMCQTCDARFRRLHDLKRHTKLHTGERPHQCPKCKRSFARGDALARHNKGQGGCAGRRSSMGSLGGDVQYDDRPQSGHGGGSGMEGMIYTGESTHEPEQMDDEPDSMDDRGKSLPSIRRHDAPPDPPYRQATESQNSYQPRTPNTYPPVAARQSTVGGLYPPGQNHAGGSSTAAPQGAQASPLSQYPPNTGVAPNYAGSQIVFAHGSMTESPKPLSPAGNSLQPGHPESGIHRNRSPSLTQQFQQQQYGRRTQTRPTPPPIGLPPPLSNSNHSNAPQLPSLPGLTPPDPRFTLHSQVPGPSHGPPVGQGSIPVPSHPSGAGTPTSYHSQQGGLSSTSNSHSSHGTHAHGSGEGGNLPSLQGPDRIWAYVQSLEAKVNRLQDEVTTLKSQLSAGPHR